MAGYTDKEMRAVIDKSFDEGYNYAIKKACEWLKGVINIEQEVKTDENGEPLADSYIDYAKKRLEEANKIIEEFKNYMKEKEMKLNKEMSKEYGLTIYDSFNEQFPYFVEEWDECFTEEEIKHHIKDYNMIEGIQFEND